MTARERQPEPVEQYLSALRARLRVRDAGLILAEAEDHLREDVAAGLAAGLTELEAQQAAISSFGPVRAVVRAHQPRWRRAVTWLGQPALAIPKVTGLLLVAVSLTSLVTLAVASLVPLRFPLPAALVAAVIFHDAVTGAAGLALLYASRRARRRAGPAVPNRPARSAATAMTLFAVTAVALIASGTSALVAPPTLACLVLAVVYGIRLGAMRRRVRQTG